MMNLNDTFKSTCSNFSDGLESLAGDAKLKSSLSAVLQHISSVDFASARIVITYEPYLEYKARHLWQELVGKYKLSRPPVPATLFSSENSPIHVSSNDLVIHFGIHRPECTEEPLQMVQVAPGPPEGKNWHILNDSRIQQVFLPHSSLTSWLLHIICEKFEPKEAESLEESTNDALQAMDKTVRSAELTDAIYDFEDRICKCISQEGVLYLAGNGGSACDTFDIGQDTNSVSLAESGYITCVANDYGFEHVFSRAVDTMIPGRDLFIALSTSGRSPNIVESLERASKRGVDAAFLGPVAESAAARTGCMNLLFYGEKTHRIQELHSVFLTSLGNWIRERE